jgi:eukaryotic-like serine/threonine-protein kinase
MQYRLMLILFILATQITVAQTKKTDTPSSRVKWKYRMGGIFGSPVSENNILYVAGLDSTLHAVDVQSGKSVWKFKTSGPIRSTPCLHESNIIVISEDGSLYNLNKINGEVNWQYMTPQGTLQERKYDRADYYQSSPVVYNSNIYFGMGDFLYAIHATTGKTLWTFRTGNLIHTKPAIANEKIVFGSFDGHLYALHAQTGSLIWKFKSVGQRYFPNGEMTGNPVIMRNTVFAGSRDYNFYAIDLNAGFCFWNKQFPRGWALSATVVRDSILYLGTSDDYLMLALDPRTGAEKWRAELKYNIFGGMAVDGNRGYVGTLMGKLFTIDLINGNVMSVFEGDGYKANKDRYFDRSDQHLPQALSIFGNFENVLTMYRELGAVFSTPVVIGNQVIYGGADGILYCLEK